MAKWTPKHEAPEPLEGPVVATITGGTILWFVLFLVQLPFYGWFDDRDLTWWVWTCLAGAGLGLIGIWYVRGRDAALKRHAAAQEAGAAAQGADAAAQGAGAAAQGADAAAQGAGAAEAPEPRAPETHPGA
ncbi:DUF2530 domain-containing protein [Streptomyces gardneri]|uniref:DUF2530 domain-containing protein n=1 Tax=Streptomyces gardneri TaxID=66892 RepID=UPI0033EA3DA9